MKVTETYMKELADKTGLVFDGNDDRLFADEDRRIDVFAQDMTKSQYTKMEKDINSFKIEGYNYIVYAWNDCSGFEYWNDSDPFGSNYIQIEAIIKGKVDPIKLKNDMEKAYEHFCHYDNGNFHRFE